MRKMRLFYYIISLICSLIMLSLAIIYDYTMAALFIIIALMIPNFYLKNKEKQFTNSIIVQYSFNCDPYQYIDSLKNYSSKCFLSKKQKLIYELYYALAYLDSGEFEKAKEKLLHLDANEKRLDEITMVLYLKAWSDYFYYNFQDEKMKETLLKLKNIIINTRYKNMKNNYSVVYTLQEAKYYILTGENLAKAKELFTMRNGVLPTKLSILSSQYQLALIDLREKKFNEAIDKLQKISKSQKENLFVTKSSQRMLERI